MPKTIPNYNNSIIYKLCCKNPEVTDIYIGSTTNFTKRKQQHKENTLKENNKKYNYYVYQVIRDKGSWNNWDMIQIEKFESPDKRTLETRERHWIDTLKPTLNQKIPTRTNKEWIEDNIEKHIAYHKQYEERRSKKYTCVCGSTIRIWHKIRHEHSQKHIKFIENSKIEI
jgi:hypothetical protein